ncbi:MAG TPA: hypothetical protein VK427_19405 [Kofleriaceae bacterium]|nr:hypothetical protein [Kofleriaceae bacterium]
MKSLQSLTVEDWVKLALPARKGSVFRGFSLGMPRAAVLKLEGKRGLDAETVDAEHVEWFRRIVQVKPNGDAAHENVTATFSRDSLEWISYCLQIEGITADKTIAAVTKVVIERLTAALGKGKKSGKEIAFSVPGSPGGRLIARHNKLSGPEVSYSTLGITLCT